MVCVFAMVSRWQEPWITPVESMQKAVWSDTWRSEAPFYEVVYDIIDPQKLTVLTRRESQNMPRNFYIRDIKRNKEKPITSLVNPYLMLEGVKKERI